MLPRLVLLLCTEQLGLLQELLPLLDSDDYCGLHAYNVNCQFSHAIKAWPRLMSPSVVTTTYTTDVVTEEAVIRSTPYTTTTTTTTVIAPGKAKRVARAIMTSAPRDLSDSQANQFFAGYMRAAAAAGNGTSNSSNAALSASFSSACACQTQFGGSTVTETYTDEEAVSVQIRRS